MCSLSAIIAEPNLNISYHLVIHYPRFVGSPEPNLFISYVLVIHYVSVNSLSARLSQNLTLADRGDLLYRNLSMLCVLIGRL